MLAAPTMSGAAWASMPEGEKDRVRAGLKSAESYAKRAGLPFRPWTEHVAEHGENA